MDQLEKLKEILKGYGKIAIAYSGGCDSNFLMNIAIDTLGKENVYCVLCNGAMLSKEDLEEAKRLLNGINHCIIDIDVFEVEPFRYNHSDRCYHCKKNIMSHVIQEALKAGFQYVCDGKNLDDGKVYRPGMKACEELGILSPIYEAGMNKQQIREYSKILGIETADKPANACLATRFDYNTELTPELLARTELAEKLFHEIGILHIRVRSQGDLARIEVEKKDFKKVIDHLELIERIKELGYRFVTLDLEGIKSGSYDDKMKGK